MKLTGICGTVVTLVLASYSQAQDSTSAEVLTFTGTVSTLSSPSSGSRTIDNGDVPTGSLTYLSISSTETITSSRGAQSRNSTETDLKTSSSSDSLTLIGGDTSTSTLNNTASSTSSSARPTNTQPCNNYPEFCSRKYSNITEVTAHNSPFVRRGNAASNQQLDVTYQLNDGIRMCTFTILI